MILFTKFGWNLPSSFEEEGKIVKRIECCLIADEKNDHKNLKFRLAKNDKFEHKLSWNNPVYMNYNL